MSTAGHREDIRGLNVMRELAAYDRGLLTELGTTTMIALEKMTSPANLSLEYEIRDVPIGIRLPEGGQVNSTSSTIRDYYITYVKQDETLAN